MCCKVMKMAWRGTMLADSRDEWAENPIPGLRLWGAGDHVGAGGYGTVPRAGVKRCRSQVAAVEVCYTSSDIVTGTQPEVRWSGRQTAPLAPSASNQALHRTIGARRHRVAETKSRAPFAGELRVIRWDR
jgi:hypothetical protein